MPDYLLKTVNPDGEAHNGFRWPLDVGAEVVAPDWDPTPKCGGGLHGALNGEGNGTLFRWEADAVWIAAEIPDGAQVVDLGGKVKVDRCAIRSVGDRVTVTAWLAERCPGRIIIGGTATAGDGGTATAGYCGTATAGYCGTATAGDGGTATAGDRGMATAGDRGMATAGDLGILNIRWWDGSRYRIATGYVGEGGIEANVAYIVRDGKLVKKEDSDA